MATADCEEDEWELLNIDGFVYKRKKRPNPTTTTTSSAPPPDLAAAEEMNRREMKKRALAKLRDKYQKEIDQWELLSNMLWAFQLKTQNSQQLQEQTTSYDLTASSPPPPEHSLESASRRLLDDLLLRVILSFFVIDFFVLNQKTEVRLPRRSTRRNLLPDDSSMISYFG
ncbi:uncharacterized protein LOC114316311 [Camellia sinensis]|uniref:uncharacterized protein LOC114316311 n=1 Tax=Camellia sinensis TaxID=4442 RepID=UPI0010360ABC|nr:uncharacterized protein LOC114316311 [Camellia sinensis]